MIDSGLKNPDRYGILAILEQESIHVSTLLTSHFHRDHIGNHRVIKEKFDSQVYMSPFTSAICCNPQKSSAYESSMLAILRGGPIKCSCDQIFDPYAEELEAGGYTFKLLPLPGHAQEHTGFVNPDGVAYLGDTILSRDILHAVRIPYCTFCKEDLEALGSLENVLITNQTTLSLLDNQELIQECLKHYPQASVQAEICNATTMRQKAVMDLNDIDLLIVVGDPHSNNSNQLKEIGKKAGIPAALLIETADDLKEEMITGAQRIAVTSGSSTPTPLTNAVIETLEDYARTGIFQIKKLSEPIL